MKQVPNLTPFSALKKPSDVDEKAKKILRESREIFLKKIEDIFKRRKEKTG